MRYQLKSFYQIMAQNDDYIYMVEQTEKQKKKDIVNHITRPFLLKRFAVGLLDLVIIFIVAALFEFILYKTIFKPLGYFDYKNNVMEITSDSGLFVDNDGSYIEVNKFYQNQDDLITNYDEKITYFYTNNELAISRNKLDEYNSLKEQSNYFDKVDGKYFIKDGIEKSVVVSFYSKQYDNAMDLLYENNEYSEGIIKTFQIIMYTSLLAFSLSISIFYLLIPMLTKEGESIGYLIGKMCLIDDRDGTKIKKWQIFMRFMTIYVINFYIPFFIYVQFKSFNLISVLISLFMISFTKRNRGPQDFASLSLVILKHRSDALDGLKAMVGDNNQ